MEKSSQGWYKAMQIGFLTAITVTLWTFKTDCRIRGVSILQ